MDLGKWLLCAFCLLLTTALGVSEDEPKDTKTKNEDSLQEEDTPRFDFYNGDSYQAAGYDNYQRMGYRENPQYSVPSYMTYPKSYQFPAEYYPYSPPGYSMYSRPYPPKKMEPFIPTYPVPIKGSRTLAPVCGTENVTCSCLTTPYRPLSGICNNEYFTSTGSSSAPLSRTKAPVTYSNTLNAVATETSSGSLPLPRVLSEVIFKEKVKNDQINAFSVMLWGQLVSHDVSLITNRKGDDGEVLKCCTDNGKMLPEYEIDSDCLPIVIPEDDPFYSKFYRTCMNMVRSEVVSGYGCTTEPINQISLVTHFLDASFLYGNSDDENSALRTGYGGLMKTKDVYGLYSKRKRAFLPQDENPPIKCDTESNKEPCYKAGDIRVNQNPSLAAIQTLFLREHNRLAEALADLHPLWEDKVLFEEARKIVIAQWQHITYEYWLPRLIGEKMIDEMNLRIDDEGFSDLYDGTINPSTMNEFTTGAYRHFHSTVQGHVQLDGEGRCPFLELRLSDFFLKPGIIESSDNFDSILRGMITQAQEESDEYVTKELTKYLFKMKKPFGSDLVSFDIQRERDHGIPSYNSMREQCGYKKAVNFEDFLDTMSIEHVYLLQSLYRSVNDVDLYVGGSLEENVVLGDKSATVGPIFGCIIAEQFFRWRAGDKYFFDNGDQAGSFTIEQLDAIRGANFSSILCENMDYVQFVQGDAFLQVYPGNDLQLCKDLPRLDLKPWKNYQPASYQCTGTSPLVTT